MKLQAAIVGAVVTLLAASAAQARTAMTPAFYTPGHAAVCQQWYLDGYLMCMTPNDGFTVFMYDTGTVPRTGDPRLEPEMRNPLYGPRTYDKRAGGLLQFGYRWSSATAGCENRPCVAVPDFTCASARTGLTCKNRSGHGWWLGRYRGYRIF